MLLSTGKLQTTSAIDFFGFGLDINCICIDQEELIERAARLQASYHVSSSGLRSSSAPSTLLRIPLTHQPPSGT